jgi:hypothetical protein
MVGRPPCHARFSVTAKGGNEIDEMNSRAAVDFAACMRDLTDVHYPKAERIRVVLDNLSIHTAGALYEAFPPCEARRVLSDWSSTTCPRTPAG